MRYIWLYIILAFLVVACTPKEERVSCCQLVMSAPTGELVNFMVCNSSTKGSISSEVEGKKLLTYYGVDKYKCVCEERKLDGTDIKIPAGNYTKEEPYSFNIFENC